MIKIEDISIDNVNEVDDKLYINFCSVKPQTLANYDQFSSKITEKSDDEQEIDWIEVTLIMDAEDCRRTKFTTYAVNDYDRARLDIKTGLNCYESILSNDEQDLLLDYAMENVTPKYIKVGNKSRIDKLNSLEIKELRGTCPLRINDTVYNDSEMCWYNITTQEELELLEYVYPPSYNEDITVPNIICVEFPREEFEIKYYTLGRMMQEVLWLLNFYKNVPDDLLDKMAAEFEDSYDNECSSNQLWKEVFLKFKDALEPYEVD